VRDRYCNTVRKRESYSRADLGRPLDLEDQETGSLARLRNFRIPTARLDRPCFALTGGPLGEQD